MMGADGDDLVPGLQELVEAVHEAGALVVCQLNHAGRQTRPEVIGGRQPVAPSAVSDRRDWSSAMWRRPSGAVAQDSMECNSTALMAI